MTYCKRKILSITDLFILYTFATFQSIIASTIPYYSTISIGLEGYNSYARQKRPSLWSTISDVLLLSCSNISLMPI